MPEITAAEITPERALQSAELLSEMQMNTAVDDDVVALEDAIDALQKIASGELAPVVHEKWIIGDIVFDKGFHNFTCSNCGSTEVWFHGYNYCPHCGAKMDGKDDSHE
jgi:hypothetical protein